MNVAFIHAQVTRVHARALGLALAGLMLVASGASAAYADAPRDSNGTHHAQVCSPVLDPPLVLHDVTDPNAPAGLDLVKGTGHCFTPGGKVRVHLRFVGTSLDQVAVDVTASRSTPVCGPDPKQCLERGGGDIDYTIRNDGLSIIGGFGGLCSYPGTGLNVRAHDDKTHANARLEIDKLSYC